MDAYTEERLRITIPNPIFVGWMLKRLDKADRNRDGNSQS